MDSLHFLAELGGGKPVIIIKKCKVFDLAEKGEMFYKDSCQVEDADDQHDMEGGPETGMSQL